MLATLNSLGVVSPTDLSSALGTSVGHVRELIRLLNGLGLVTFDGKVITPTQESRQFLTNYASHNVRYVDEVLSRVEQYRKARKCFEDGMIKPSDVARCANLNIVTADTALRLIKEVRSLGDLSDSPEPISVNVESFGLVLCEAYRDLATKRRNKHIPIHDLMNYVAKKLSLNPRVFADLLARLLQERKGLVMLTPSPSLADRPYIEIGGRRYTYLIFLKECPQ